MSAPSLSDEQRYNFLSGEGKKGAGTGAIDEYDNEITL